MRKLFVAVLCVAIGLFVSIGGSAVFAQTRPAAPLPRNSSAMMSVDREFVMTAAEAGLANIAMGQLALQKSTNPQVRQFAQAEIAEQQQLKQNFSRVAPRLRVALPTAPGPKYQALMAKLSQLSGEQFNRAYLSEGGVNAHLENAAVFQREAQFGQEPSVIAIANQSLPVIQSHFSTASGLTNYRFAQVSQRFNDPATTGTSQSNISPVVPPAATTPAVR